MNLVTVSITFPEFPKVYHEVVRYASVWSKAIRDGRSVADVVPTSVSFIEAIAFPEINRICWIHEFIITGNGIAKEQSCAYRIGKVPVLHRDYEVIVESSGHHGSLYHDDTTPWIIRTQDDVPINRINEPIHVEPLRKAYFFMRIIT
ncbi:MAG: hypothetical protein IPJ76_15375 [Flavobacteriales bacterium]|nr:MAG: hypothetical protein IPJ76_15375 [Flavobacteriales bacterium]